jgi:mercuric ion transport protein
MSSVKGYLSIISALVLCPCHLPIYGAVLAGSTVGAAITDHYGLLFPLMAIYFAGALFIGVRWMTRSDPATCDRCEAQGSMLTEEEAAVASPPGAGLRQGLPVAERR